MLTNLVGKQKGKVLLRYGIGKLMNKMSTNKIGETMLIITSESMLTFFIQC